MFVFRVIPVRIQSECGKMRARITLNMDTFHAAIFYNIFCCQSSKTSLFPNLFFKLHNQLYIKVLGDSQPTFTCSKSTNGNTKTVCEICSNLTKQKHQNKFNDIFMVNCEQISDMDLVFPLLF